MSAFATPEATALAAALSAMLAAPIGELTRCARVVSRAADDAEVAAAEAANLSTRRALMEQIDAARGAAAAAREQARRIALEKGREKLLEGAVEEKREGEGTTARIAKEINNGLRRVTAVVKEEVERSRATGGVVEESGRRLRMTRDQHLRYGDRLRSGAKTLTGLKRVDLMANVAVILSFLFFFLVAGYVVNRKLADSNTATFLVRPVAKILSAPIRVGVRLSPAIVNKLIGKTTPHSVITGAEEADVKEKAREGREDASVTIVRTRYTDKTYNSVTGNPNAETELANKDGGGLNVDTTNTKDTGKDMSMTTDDSGLLKKSSRVVDGEQVSENEDKIVSDGSVGSKQDSGAVADERILSGSSSSKGTGTESREMESLVDAEKIIQIELERTGNDNLPQGQGGIDKGGAGHEDL